MKKFCIIIIVLFPLSLFSQGWNQHIDVHLYPHSLSPQDSLQDGPYGKKLDIQEDAFFIWVDLFPGMFFTHKTAYILISKENVRIERGDWWPVLNGKMILHNEHSKYALISPFELPLISAYGFIDDRIDIHVYPHELTSQDQLTDGPLEKLFKMDDNCLLVWVDFLPGAFFAHRSPLPPEIKQVESSLSAVAVGGACPLSPRFLWECLNSLTVTRFPRPAHRTGLAVFPHPALGLVSRQRLRSRHSPTVLQPHET